MTARAAKLDDKERLAELRELKAILRRAGELVARIEGEDVDGGGEAAEEPTEPTTADYERVKRLKSKKGIRHGA